MARRTVVVCIVLALSVGFVAVADRYRMIAWDVRALVASPGGIDRLASYLSEVDAQYIHLGGIDPSDAPAVSGLLPLQGGHSLAAWSAIQPLREGIFTPAVKTPIGTSTVLCGDVDDVGFVSSDSNYWLQLDFGKTFAAVIGFEFTPRSDECRDDIVREGEAEAIRLSSLLRIGHVGEVILLGAVNDVDGDVPDASSHQPATDVLRLLKDPDDTMCGVEFFNVCELLPQAERYTAMWRGAPIQLDYIFVTRVLRSMVKRVWIDHQAPTVPGAERWPVFLDLEICPASTAS